MARPGLLGRLAEDSFGMDTRSLAAFRIAFGVIVSLDVLNRVSDVTVHYTDKGALPRWAVIENLARTEHISLHMASGTAGWELFLFAIHLVCAVMMIVGFKTRLATAVCWALTVSLHNRNPLVLHSGDVIIRQTLFWSMFLPLASRWSIDARRPPLVPPPPTTFTSVGTLGFIAQITFVYIFTWALKTGPAWHDGTAIYYTLSIDHFVKQPQASLMLQHLDLLEMLTNSVIWFEIIGPILVFLPFFKGPLRTFLVFAFWGLHLGFFVFMELGLFPWTCIVVWSALLPGWFWDRLRVPSLDGPPLRVPLWSQGVAAAVLALITLWNLNTINPHRFPLFDPIETVGRTFRLDQKWEMFAPYPLKDDGWFVVAAKQFDGTEFEVLRGGPVSFDKPEGIAQSYGGQRWSKYMRNLWQSKYKDMRLYYGRYICRDHNKGKRRGQKDAMEGFEMFFMKEMTPPPGEVPTIEKKRIWKHQCYDTPSTTGSSSTPKSADGQAGDQDDDKTDKPGEPKEQDRTEQF